MIFRYIMFLVVTVVGIGDGDDQEHDRKLPDKAIDVIDEVGAMYEETGDSAAA